MKGLLIVISAPSGTGKTTLVNMLMKEIPTLEFSISCTTRKPRPGEVNGKDYYFLSLEEFEKKIENNELLEWAEVYGNFYGTPKDKVLQALKEGKDILLDIDTQGALQVKKNYPDAVLIFILPPSLKELEKRLKKRGTEDPETIERRLLIAHKEISLATKYDYIIVNDQIERAFENLKSIITAERWKTHRIKEQFDEIINDKEMLELLKSGA
ncbi:guanylate kinase [Desulfurobacterium atlanticum]|uniref:Guanylate kinase n=1 Tax=Desulfurobacterium atlanticum TaxID=240169 RepID=A0A238ZCU5_9BACT|nr:guanylate kinase [Desulfurobacterium atlanticum]SNR81345.1 guanylate kinase [Desulfurobacterium atlanticum]